MKFAFIFLACFLSAAASRFFNLNLTGNLWIDAVIWGLVISGILELILSFKRNLP